jgi:hypothetical protein
MSLERTNKKNDEGMDWREGKEIKVVKFIIRKYFQLNFQLPKNYVDTIFGTEYGEPSLIRLQLIRIEI